MYAQVEKSKENKKRAVANSGTQKKSNTQKHLKFVGKGNNEKTHRHLDVRSPINEAVKEKNNIHFPSVLQLMTINTVKGTEQKKIEVKNDKVFKGYIRGLQRAANIPRIKQYISQMEEYLKIKKLSNDEVKNIEWAIKWMKDRLSEKPSSENIKTEILEEEKFQENEEEYNENDVFEEEKHQEGECDEGDDEWQTSIKIKKSPEEKKAIKDRIIRERIAQAEVAIQNEVNSAKKRESTLCVFLNFDGQVVSVGESGWDKKGRGKEITTYLEESIIKNKSQSQGYGGVQCAEPQAVLDMMVSMNPQKAVYSLAYDQKSKKYKPACGSCKTLLEKYKITDLFTYM